MKKKKPVISIICIGDELLEGNTLNTNSFYLINALKENGFLVRNTTCIRDNEEAILRTLDQEFQLSNIILTTGGLGPTFDDITLETIAKYFHEPLTFNRDAYESIANYFISRKKKIQKKHEQQAYLPKSAEIIGNKAGVCPAIILNKKERCLIAMPGVPREVKGMFVPNVIPYLKKRYFSLHIRQSILKTAGKPEVFIESKIKSLVKKLSSESINFGIYPDVGEVKIKITVKETSVKKAKEKLLAVEAMLSEKVTSHLYGKGEDTLQKVLYEKLKKNKKTISLAESCTGGLISSYIAKIPGISKYFIGSSIVYSNHSKVNQMEVSPETLKKYGAVSREVARELCLNAREIYGSDIGLSVTGIAGPSGGTKDKPIGLVYIGIAIDDRVKVFQYEFSGDREVIQLRTYKFALFNLIQLMDQ